LIRAALAALVLLAGPAAAEERLDGPAFEALSEGWTLHFERDGLHFGSEQFFEGRRSLWRAGEMECEEGIWYESEGSICFVYESVPIPQCWLVMRRGEDIFARATDDPAGLAELRMSRRDQVPLSCPGPSVGA
jgi:hypothetical protein